MKKKALWFVPAACAVAMAAIMTAESSRLKEDDLFVSIQRLAHFLQQLGREGTVDEPLAA